MKKHFDVNTLKWLYKANFKQNFLIVILIFAHMILGGSGVLYALLLRNAVDGAVGHNAEIFKNNIIKIIILIVAQMCMSAGIRWLNEYTRTSYENNLKKRLAREIFKKDYSSVSAIHSGEWLNRMTNDTVVVANGYVDILPGLFGTVVKLISALIMIVALDPWFAYILVPGGLLIVILTYAFRKILKKLHKNVQEKDGKLRIFLQERLGSLMMIKSFAAEQQTETSLDEKLRDHKRARMKRMEFSNFCNIGFGAAMDGMYMIGICYCGYGILNGTISYGTLTAITQLIGQVESPFANISGYLPRYYAVAASAERLMEIESLEDDSEIQAMPLEKTEIFYKKEFASFGLKNASFTYNPTAEGLDSISKEGMPVVLKDISIALKKGEYVAFTGHSGCGKSTILKLLMCVYKLDEGERYLKDIKGEEHPLTPEWRRLFAYVPQGNHLISGTIREVITFADPDHADDDERINRAIKIACADEFIAELEDGVDTLLGERGAGLSEGQMQRIAIARAVFSGSPILLLDESTSALDETTEKKLLENIRSLTDKTVIIVTHRNATLSICDRILHFEEDGITERKIPQ